MIKKIHGRLLGRQKIQWIVVSDRVNEISDKINEIIEILSRLEMDKSISKIINKDDKDKQ